MTRVVDKRARAEHYKLYGKYKRVDRAPVNYSYSTLERAKKYLESVPNGIETAVARALKRAVIAGRMEVYNQVSENYTVERSEVRRTIRLIYPKKGSGSFEGRLSSTGKRIPLEMFEHEPLDSDTTGNRRKQVRVGVRRGELKPLRTGFKWKGRILARVQGNHLYPEFKRGDETPLLDDSDARFKYGLSVPEMLGSKSIRPFVNDRMVEVFNERLEHEVDHILRVGIKG